MGFIERRPWNGGPCRDRTYDQEIKSLLLYQLSYAHHRSLIMRLACPAGLEPATLGLEGRCSIRLSYGHDFEAPLAGPAARGARIIRKWLKERQFSVSAHPQRSLSVSGPKPWRPQVPMPGRPLLHCFFRLLLQDIQRKCRPMRWDRTQRPWVLRRRIRPRPLR